MNQKKIWNNIAEEWHEFKTKPAENVIEFLKKQTGNVLDLGSGSGRHLIKIKKGKIYLVDFSEKMLKLAGKKADERNIKAEFIKADFTKLPFQNDFFDSAVFISSLHCIKGSKKREKAVEELHRVLKSNAEVFVGVWNKNSKRFKNAQNEKYVKWRDKGERYYYLFEEDEIHKLFKKRGFKITSTLSSELMINFIAEKT
ncbi:MAG: class I SAM-dependent methyltransferase [archaeon]